MKKNYTNLIQKVKERSNPENLPIRRLLFESAGIPYTDVGQYVKLAMAGVPLEYTNNSKAAAKKVMVHLEKLHDKNIEFRFQGSVETNTHILNDNDIDLLQISLQSSTVDRASLKTALDESWKYTNKEYKNLKEHSDNFTLYGGDQLSDLGKIRIKSEETLQSIYKDVDISKPKAIAVEVKTPLRKVDVATAVYYKAIPYMKSNSEHKKGIQIYNKETDSKLPVEFPFWSIKRINEKSILSNGRLKKMIRFLKNIKCDTSQITGKPKISSFDINAICYDIDLKIYDSSNYLELVMILYNQISLLASDESYRNNLKSVDAQEYIFRSNPEKVSELYIFKSEIDAILSDIYSLKLIAV
ncbi:hypothetical protein DVK85_04655 [Flavobacterium arcticum]|uniref:cGAS/DncV-like nucleotidyltransferase C-terminal helical domain-containing protein n=1 Tax=Flavobacterium arcticum TaxID=1784713 RepID=A0A345HAE8_9FLAO|nr:hypothetical protein [Flavobacterium arcticum]AXG73558.1 hypothetical protein DVK85_04655 [Flavobacterium arcticum]KAF2513350.1 hypothetical protein E0W72_02710 [Flavobacterium arcticum]